MRNAFIAAAEKAGALTVACETPEQVVRYLAEKVQGPLILPSCPSLVRSALAGLLQTAGVEIIADDFRRQAPAAAAGLTGANFAIAATGTVVLESTAEAIRLASTLPERHFILLDPAKIISDSGVAVPFLRQLHARLPQTYLAYITGPSRTADIERVLTIGVHGPKELHILLCAGVSDDFMES
jgi:L-lactate dehydrogenase complex protein LldG